MAAVSEDPIALWLKLGALDKLEQVVLDGYGDQLYGKTSRIPQVNKFLRQVPLFQNKIDEIHKAVSTGSLREVQHLIDRKKLAFCRDPVGASPMHKAVLFSQKPIIDYLLDRYPSVVHARDHRGRTPLHYAAVLADGGEIYQMLLDHGADVKATDVFGNRPEYYMHAQDEMNVQVLKDGGEGKVHKTPKKNKYLQSNGVGGKEIVVRSAKPAGPRIHIKEMINNGDVEALEETVLQGHGDRLLGEQTSNPVVWDFIRMVPVYMERIYEIHRAAARGRMRDVQTLLDRKKLAVARDPLGATPLHKAVMYGHKDVAQYIAQNFPLSRDAKDLDGRTALHYAAALKDNHETYNMLIALGANPLVLDYRGKTTEYYLQFPEHLHLGQLIKQSQRTNANYMANQANRMKLSSPKRKSPYPARSTLSLDANANLRHVNGDASDDTESSSEALKNGHLTFRMPKKSLFRSQPLLPPPKLKRLEINSANIKRWIRDEDFEKLEGAVLEGYGDKVALQKTDNAKLQHYIEDQVPKLVKKIEAIHSAISNDDLTELQSQLEHTDYMVLAKDPFGMAPIHRAVLTNKPDVLAFLIDRFPETVNARDKEGRTALHYAAAMSREPSSTNYFKILLEAGADPRIRDSQGRSPEYYRTHHVPIPHKLNQQQPSKAMAKKPVNRSKSEPPHPRAKRLPGIQGGVTLPQAQMDKVTQWLQHGDVDPLKEFAYDGYGQYLVGKTSWNEEVRQYLKTLPSYLMLLGSSFLSVERGDVRALTLCLAQDENLLRARNAEGSTLLHQAVLHDQMNVLNYFLDKHPNLLNIKDRNGRTALHVAGQQKNHYMYTVLATAGAEPMILDQKGRTAEFYLNSAGKPNARTRAHSPGTPDKADAPDRSPRRAKPPEPEKREPTPEPTPPPPPPEEPKKEDEEAPKEEPETEESDEKAEKSDEPPPTDSDPKETEDGAPKEPEVQPEPEPEKADEGEPQPDTGEKADEKETGSDMFGSSGSEAQVSTTGDRLNELIDVWIRERDLLRLEHVVIAGQGERLVGRSSDDRQVQEFLELVPTYMARIRGVHNAVVRGGLSEVEAVLTRKRFALSRDPLGASPLHLAVLHGHTEVVKYIIDNFPEALDGPDNEGRTPLHYAAVMRDGGSAYRILLMAGADETAVDKANHTPDYYLTHPGLLTIRDLLEGYRIEDPPGRRPSQVNIWQRPPTEDFEKRDLFDAHDDDDEFWEPDVRTTPSDTPGAEPEPEEAEEEEARAPVASIYPILFDRQNRDSRYLAGVLGDALIKGLTQVAQRRPRDPIGYLATYLYQYAARSGRSLPNSREVFEEPEQRVPSASPAKPEALDEEVRPRSTPEPATDDFEDDQTFALEFEDHTKMKDEEGQTVLHFAASRVHPDGSFYGLLSHAESLLAERDGRYRTCRDVAEEAGQQENVSALDRFVGDAHLQGRAPLLRMLLHEGYEPLWMLDDLAVVLRQRGMHVAAGFLREAAEFARKREELHGYIRNSYLEGVCRLAKSDAALVTAKGPRARCALHVAVLIEHVDIVTQLVKANASAVHVTDNLGRTPLHYAMATEKVEKLAKILIKAGALRITKDVRMRTPSYFFIYKEEIQDLREEEVRLA